MPIIILLYQISAELFWPHTRVPLKIFQSNFCNKIDLLSFVFCVSVESSYLL